jgi:hypothetical protein
MLRLQLAGVRRTLAGVSWVFTISHYFWQINQSTLLTEVNVNASISWCALGLYNLVALKDCQISQYKQ